MSIGRTLFLTVTVFGMGLLLGLDTLISTAFGRGDVRDCNRSLVHGVYLAFLIAVPLTVVVYAGAPLIRSWGIDEGVETAALPYLRAVAWSALPLMLYTTFRRFLQAINRVRPVMVALISANLVNVAGNWVLIFGHLGAPALGAEGAGWATCISSSYLALVLLAAIVIFDREEKTDLRRTPLLPEVARLRRLLQLGLPAASQYMVEVAAFATATALVGRLVATALAAHTIALTAASVTFMVPLGISSAAAVRVGQSVGRRDPDGAASAGWTALLLGTGFMLIAALSFLVLPVTLMRLFTPDPAVIAAGVSLLAVAAFFQLSDGVQVVATGALRGLGDTRSPFAWNVVGHWLLGLPLGYSLCFIAGWGAVGLWIGMLVGLTAVAAGLLTVWTRRMSRERASGPTAAGMVG